MGPAARRKTGGERATKADDAILAITGDRRMAKEQIAESSDEEKLRSRIESLTGGKVVSIVRQARWRPAWFVNVKRGEETLHIHVRGDRNSDIMPFPELSREADIIEVLEEHGIPVPHIYGMCEDPVAIIMQAVRGTRDVSTAADDAQRRSISRQFIGSIAAMHNLPIAPFVARGLKEPKTPQEIALAGLDAYWPLYERNKHGPEPLIEFAVRWLRTNVPTHRTKASFIQFDCGQFLFEDGRVTSLYDFEFAMIGESMTDLATMRMRDSYEPLGAPFSEICRNYAAARGEPVDVGALRFQNALFSTVSCMQIAGRVSAPSAGDPHDTYLEWDIALKRVLVLILAECMNVKIELPKLAPSPPGGNLAALNMLKDAVEQIKVSEDMQAARKTSALNLVEYLLRADELGAWLDRTSREEAVQFIGADAVQGDQFAAKLERFVQSAGPEYDERLLRYFAAQAERRVLVFGPTRIGRSAQHVYLPPIE
jgi:aminoglycoside phosphotransferase (APT) family kinase protein